MKKLYNWKISPEMIIATPGVVKGFYTAARAVCSPGDGLLMQPPVYFPFLRTHEQAGLVRQLAPLTARSRKGHIIEYEIDFEVFNAALNSENAQTRMFLLCNPHNPTGAVYSRKQLARMAKTCLEHNIVICSDEIHSEILLGRARHIPMARLSPEIENQTITLVAASKAYNVPGLFCGFAIIPNPELRKKFKAIVDHEFLHPNSMGVAAAKGAFSGKSDRWLAQAKRYLTANRDFLVKYLRKELPEISYTIPD
ncbi:MAG: aminotransferase class I/II-fold pyridoxal phosphate-dependent enzyme, partial [Chloroflexota bacterium]|nr:aminotransferase class I/II-fold pyridoxal phosphate-dependent enzyme [Chloroflexota bacterium]